MTPIVVKVRHGVAGLGEMEVVCNGGLMLRYGGRLYCFGEPIPAKIKEEDAEAVELAVAEAIAELYDRRQ